MVLGFLTSTHTRPPSACVGFQLMGVAAGRESAISVEVIVELSDRHGRRFLKESWVRQAG